MADSELHQYIHNVLEKGDHGKSRIIEFDAPTFNDAIDRHAAKIGEGHPTTPLFIASACRYLIIRVSNLAAQRIRSDAVQAFQQLDPRKQTVHNYLGNIKFRCTVVKPSSLEELVEVIVRAKKEKQKVRAVGAFHAWS
jgi:hypothetical protein